jgi:hypothetical protein
MINGVNEKVEEILEILNSGKFEDVEEFLTEVAKKGLWQKLEYAERIIEKAFNLHNFLYEDGKVIVVEKFDKNEFYVNVFRCENNELVNEFEDDLTEYELYEFYDNVLGG